MTRGFEKGSNGKWKKVDEAPRRSVMVGRLASLPQTPYTIRSIQRALTGICNAHSHYRAGEQR